MGLLGKLFGKKEEHVHFVRNEAGDVIDVEREMVGRKGSRTPVSDKLIAQGKMDKVFEKQEWKRQQKEAYQKAFHESRLKRMAEQGHKAGSTTIGDRLGRMASQQPSHRTNRSSKTHYRFKDNANPFGSMFDSGIGYNSGWSGPTQVKMKSNVKKVKSMDMFDNFGFMKKGRK
jgi:hypothetical protein